MTKLNPSWKVSRMLAVPVLAAALAMAGCGIAQWIQTVEQVIPVVLPMVSNLIAAVALLEGKTVSAQDLTTLTNTATQVSNDLSLLGQLIQQYQAQPAATTLDKISSTVSDTQNQLGQILPALHITDAATVQKITAIVNLISEELNAIAKVIPAVTTGSTSAAKVLTARVLSAQELKTRFNAIVTEPAGNGVVNAAFASVALK
jgi:hypothetical protein